MELSKFDFDVWITALEQYRSFVSSCGPSDLPDRALRMECAASARKNLRYRRDGTLVMTDGELLASREAVTLFLDDMNESLDGIPLTHPDRDALFASAKSCNNLLSFFRNQLRSESPDT